MKKINIFVLSIISVLSFSALSAEVVTEETKPAKIIVEKTKPTVVKATSLKVTTKKALPAPVAKIAPTREVVIQLPTVPRVPTVTAIVPKLILLDQQGNTVNLQTMEKHYANEKKVIFSDHVAPPRFNAAQEDTKVEILVGDVDSSRVAAYLHAPLMSADEAKAKLINAGFNILSTYKIDKKGKVLSIVFTNKDIEKMAAKKMRGFAASLRLTIDTKNKLVSIANPIFMMKAFMQKEYDEALAVKTLTSIRNAFTDLKNSEELVKFRVLERFRFMENMPYYQDMKLVTKGTNKELLAKAKKSKKLVFEQHLVNGSILIGVKLGKRTKKFVKKIGYQNSGLLPYPVLIENGEAKILAPQYYIAVMYPKLKMSQFMKIATIPGAIGKDIDRVFR